MKKTALSTVKFLTIPTLFFLLLNVPAQNTKEEIPQPTPEAKTPSRERKNEKVKKSATVSNTPGEGYSTAPNSPPTVDYLKESEKFQRRMESNSRKQNADVQDITRAKDAA